MKKGTKVTLFAAAVTGAALAGARLARLVRLQNEELNDMIHQEPGYNPAPKEAPPAPAPQQEEELDQQLEDLEQELDDLEQQMEETEEEAEPDTEEEPDEDEEDQDEPL